MSQATAIVAMAVQAKIAYEKDAAYHDALSIRGTFVGAPDPVAIKADLDAANAAYLAAAQERNNYYPVAT